MRSPDEYEAAFYADTTNLDPPSTLETTNRASNKPGDPHHYAQGMQEFRRCHTWNSSALVHLLAHR
jgi:hypothetical protein